MWRLGPWWPSPYKPPMQAMRALQETLAQASEHMEVVAELIHGQADIAIADEGPVELVSDKVSHSQEVVRQLAEAGIRSYISEPERGRGWDGQSAEQAAVYGNRRRVRGERGKQLLRQRGERLEPTMAHLYETGRMDGCTYAGTATSASDC